MSKAESMLQGVVGGTVGAVGAIAIAWLTNVLAVGREEYQLKRDAAGSLLHAVSSARWGTMHNSDNSNELVGRVEALFFKVLARADSQDERTSAWRLRIMLNAWEKGRPNTKAELTARFGRVVEEDEQWVDAWLAATKDSANLDQVRFSETAMIGFVESWDL